MSGVDCCGLSASGQEVDIENIKSIAREQAREKNTSIAVCKDGADYFCTEAAVAIASGFQIIDIVSCH